MFTVMSHLSDGITVLGGAGEDLAVEDVDDISRLALFDLFFTDS